MSLILTSEIGEGATGIVHGGTLKVVTSEPTHFSRDVAVKLSLLDDQRVRLRNEYAIYRTLESNGVKGLSTVLGMFDDVEEGSTILIMTHAGTPLHRDRVISSGQRYVAHSLISVTWVPYCLTIEQLFLAILTKIHNAGILHCDLRLQNLLSMSRVKQLLLILINQREALRRRRRNRSMRN
jgi:serine/threonine protein kinase